LEKITTSTTFTTSTTVSTPTTESNTPSSQSKTTILIPDNTDYRLRLMFEFA
jgi:hypothetical protein